MGIKEKIQHSIELLRRYEALAAEKGGGYYLAFSGGKDSQVIYHLAKKAGVKFEAHYNVTTNDAPQNVYFIRDNYPDVIMDLPEKSFLQLIHDALMLPSMTRRFCCAKLKEEYGKGRVVVTGIRAEESRKRAERSECYIAYSSLTQRERERERERDGLQAYSGIVKDIPQYKNCKILLNPILTWTEEEVWHFIEDNGIPLNPCYEQFGRVGCLFCPYKSKKALEYTAKTFPKHYRLLMREIEYVINTRKEKDGWCEFESAADMWEWWISKKPIKQWKEEKKQLNIEFEQ